MSITAERKTELIAEYAELKQCVTTIDDKYTLNYVLPQVDLPPSLGLEHIPFDEKTEAELRAIAAENVQPTYLSQKDKLIASYTSGLNSNTEAQAALAEKDRKVKAQLLYDYTVGWKKQYARLVNANLMFSSAVSTSQQKLLDKYNAAVVEQNTDFAAEKSLLDDKKTNLQAKHQADLAALEQRRLALVEEEYNSLAAKQDKARLANQKYNAGLDEREVRYQASCKKFIEQAKQEEYTRKLTASRLLAELGTTGVEQQRCTEKYYVCCDFALTHWSKEEAKYVLSLDSFLSNQLGTYYTQLVDYIDTQLV